MNHTRSSLTLRMTLAMFVAAPWPAVQAGLFGPDNYWECILEGIEGVQNDLVAIEVVNQCHQQFPKRLPPEVQEGSLFLGPDTAGECVTQYGKDIHSPYGANAMRDACFRLYPKSAEE